MMKNYDKIYDDWNKVKKNLNKRRRVPEFSEGEVWWSGVGRNLGVEIFGKNKNFSRPVLIYKKLNRHSFISIPVTSKNHTGNWYCGFTLKSKPRIAVLSQIKIMSSSRLYDRLGQVGVDDLGNIEASLLDFLRRR